MMTEESDPLNFTRIDSAYWEWHKANCPFDRYKSSKDEKRWRDETPFPYLGKLWKRSATPMKSNSGKTVSAWHVSFRAEDGTSVHNDVTLNRRNDAERNWGLGPD